MFDFILFFIFVIIIILAIVAALPILRRGKPTRLPNGAVMGYYIDGLPTATDGEGLPVTLGPVGVGFVVNSVTPCVLPWSNLIGPNDCGVRVALRKDIRESLEGAFDGDVITILSNAGRPVATVTARVTQAQHRTGWWAQGMSVSGKEVVAKAKARW